MRTSYPAAERVALDLILEADATIETAMAAWVDAYEGRFPWSPGASQRAAAEAMLRQRLDGVAPPPPSARATALRLPEQIGGIPE